VLSPAPAPVGSEMGCPLGTAWGSGMLRSAPADPRPKTPPVQGGCGVREEEEEDEEQEEEEEEEEEEMGCLSSGVTAALLLALGVGSLLEQSHDAAPQEGI